MPWKRRFNFSTTLATIKLLRTNLPAITHLSSFVFVFIFVEEQEAKSTPGSQPRLGVLQGLPFCITSDYSIMEIGGGVTGKK